MTTEQSQSALQMPGKAVRRMHSIQYKLEVVREALQPGASSRAVARRHGLHESLIGAWRRLHAQGRLQQIHDGAAQVSLLPVQVEAPARRRPRVVEAATSAAVAGGAIHIEFSHGHRLSVRGEVDANALSAIIRELTRS